MPIYLPVTMGTAGVLAVIFLVLSANAVAGRAKHRIILGDEGNDDMRARMRAQGNFVEYAPIFLILMALLELAQANRTALLVFGGLMILARLAHAYGIPRPAPNPFRAVGFMLSFLLIAAEAIYVLIIAGPYLLGVGT